MLQDIERNRYFDTEGTDVRLPLCFRWFGVTLRSPAVFEPMLLMGLDHALFVFFGSVSSGGSRLLDRHKPGLPVLCPLSVAAVPAFYRAYLPFKTFAYLVDCLCVYDLKSVSLTRLEAELSYLVKEAGHAVLRMLPKGIDRGVAEEHLRASGEADAGRDVLPELTRRLYLVYPVICPDPLQEIRPARMLQPSREFHLPGKDHGEQVLGIVLHVGEQPDNFKNAGVRALASSMIMTTFFPSSRLG